MSNIKIVTDSSATMEQSKVEELGIHVIPLTVMIDNIIYIDGVTINGSQFMDLMEKSPSLPKTSQPPIGEFVELYNELGRDGSTIISIHLAETLSGTVNTARQAAAMADANVIVIDSHYTDQAQAFQVQLAAEMAQEGKSADEIVAAVEDLRDNHTHLYMGVADMDNMVKGGRVSRVVGLVSNFLKIRVMLEMYDSQLHVIGKGRGSKFFYRWFDKFMDEIKDQNVTRLGISHADANDLAEYFKDSLQPLMPEVSIPVLQTTPIVATHSGPGAFSILYTTK